MLTTELHGAIEEHVYELGHDLLYMEMRSWDAGITISPILHELHCWVGMHGSASGAMVSRCASYKLHAWLAS